jgi:hypothetical protein
MNQVIIDLKEYEDLKKAFDEQREEIKILKQALDTDGKMIQYGGTGNIIRARTQNEVINEIKKDAQYYHESFMKLEAQFSKLIIEIKSANIIQRLYYLFTGILE